jgi:hypothetical protein
MQHETRGRVPYDDDYPTCERADAVVTLRSSALRPDQITSILGIHPTSTALADGMHVWTLSTEASVHSRDLRRHLDWLINTINPVLSRLADLRALRGVEVTVRCIWWSRYGDGGPILSPDQMSFFSKADLELWFEFGFYGEAE